MKNIAEIENALINYNPRSTWNKAVKDYALELIWQIREYEITEGRVAKDMSELKTWALNGARDWNEYSYYGYSLIYNFDIAERCCTPSELKRVKGGKLQPNSCENWLDVQARALFQAFELIKRAF